MNGSDDQPLDESSTTRCATALLPEQLEFILDNVSAVIMLHNHCGQAVYVSSYAEILTGYSPEEIISWGEQLYNNLVIAEDQDRLERAKHISLLGEEMVVRYQILHKQGLQLWLETRFIPLLDEESCVEGMISVSNDITSHVVITKQLEEKNQDLSDFTYMVSHDLKAPIFTIKGMANAIAEDYFNVIGQEGKELVNYILEASSQLEILAQSVIEYSSLSRGTKLDEDVDINITLEAVCRDLGPLIKESSARVIKERPLPILHGENVRWYQVLSNLVGNAIKYRSTERAPVVEISSWSNKDVDFLCVSDNGMGIPQEHLSEIFRPYYRVKGTNVEGSGIGLACVHKIITQLRGEIEVESIIGNGTKFTIKLRRR